jgi:fucose 4-O-acetylase-like acetyltransferase
MTLPIEETVSKRINSLRFLLIVFVVIIHNGISAKSFSERSIEALIPAYVENVQRFIGIITAVAVPLFFLISSYLLYTKETKLVPVLKKKCRTIVLPYFLWNLLLVLFYFLMQSAPYTKQFFNSAPEYMIKNYDLIDWIDVFVGKFTEKREYNYPFVYQFWFLRDLFILNILFICIKKLVDRFPLGTLVLFSILWVNNIKIYILSPEALLFFTFGYYIVKHSLGLRNIDQIKIIPLNGVYILVGYFFMIVFGVFVSLLCGIVVKKLFPNIYALLTGGRV